MKILACGLTSMNLDASIQYTVQREIFEWCKFSHISNTYKFCKNQNLRKFLTEMTTLPDSFSYHALDAPVNMVGAYHRLDGERSIPGSRKAQISLCLPGVWDKENSKIRSLKFILTENSKLYKNMHQRKVPTIRYTECMLWQ